MIKCIRIYDQLEKGKDQFCFVEDKYPLYFNMYNFIFDDWDVFEKEIFEDSEYHVYKAAYDEAFGMKHD